MTDEELFGQVDTTAICDADKATRVLDSGIRLRSANPRIFGPAYTVRCRDDFLGVLRAIEAAEPGDVIVVDGGGKEVALGGELFARGALVRRLGGIVVDAGYRDIGYVEQCALPVYSRYVTPMAGTTGTPGELQTAISCGGVTVHPGDLVLADHEGLIVVEPAKVRGVLEAAAAIKRAEQAVVDRLDNGQTLSDGLNLDEHVAALERGEPSALRFLD
jgi:4-hydroxy-4-methyl-2-oxoglutarate aldolase